MIPKTLRRFVRATRKNEIAWRYGLNFLPTLNQRLHAKPLTGEARRVLADLTRDGIAVSTVDALLDDPSTFQALSDATDRVAEERRADLESARRTAQSDDTIGKKTFMVEYLGRNPVLDPESVWAKFALQRPVLDVANAYLGMYTQMRYYNVWHTFATSAKARESQLWHRDREDLFILKAFVYLRDVDHGAGPFTYAKGTHRKGSVREEPGFFLEADGTKRTEDAQMAEVVDPKNWLTAVGRRGTIIFADVHGYHKGGLAREQDRLMYTCMFTSQASESEEFFVRPPSVGAAGDAVGFALTR